MKTFQYSVQDEAGTEKLAAALARALPPQAVIALHGTLGAGKTRFVQALAAAVGFERSTVVSPTFVLLQTYAGRQPIHHFDAYRLRDEDEFLALGADEYLAGPGWSIIEWAERVEPALPRDRIEIRIDVTGPSSRRFEISGCGPECEAVVRKINGEFGIGNGE
jgi:tRNA threonylcarbamoyladenosine biosynthesis protein TsaE